jgi:hypothetical protein
VGSNHHRNGVREDAIEARCGIKEGENPPPSSAVPAEVTGWLLLLLLLRLTPNALGPAYSSIQS